MAKKFTTLEVIEAIIKDKSKVFTSKDYARNKVKCYYNENFTVNNFSGAYIVLEYHDGHIKPLVVGFGVSGKGVMTWEWEEVTKPVTAFEAIQICMTSDKFVSFHREDDDSLLMYSKGDGVVMFSTEDYGSIFSLNRHNWVRVE